MLFIEYTVVNRSPNNYNNFRIAQWDDPLLGGDYYDDFIGFDSAWRMGITYKADNNDGLIGGGVQPASYGSYPPKSAVTMIVLPGDSSANYLALGSFVYYNNDASIIGNPVVDTEYNNYMRAKLRNGEHFTDDFMGPGIPSMGYGSGPDCNYVFPGDPSDTNQWSECACNNNPGNRRYIFSSNDFTLHAGASQKVVFALLATNQPDGGCPFGSFDSIKTVADTAWADYYNPPAQAYITSPSANNPILIYPNPVLSELYIVNNYSIGEPSIDIYNMLGQKLYLPVTQNGTGNIIDVSSLPTAMYYILYRKDNVQKTAKFLKE
jgi:Secretion system C-terminal sorting domain